MHRNAIWIALLVIVIALSLGFAFKAGVEIFRYIRLSSATTAQIQEWNIKQQRDNHYFITVDYNFYHSGLQYEGKEKLRQIYPNPWAAEYDLKELSKKTWIVWYDRKNPLHATLEKKFPSKILLSSGILLLLLIYFFYVGFYVGGNSGRQTPFKG